MEGSGRIVEIGPYKVPVVSIGKGRPTLFLHGIDGALPESSLADLASDRLVFAPVHPGFDGTPSHLDIHNIHNVAVFYLELLDQLEVFHVDVIGHSLGAMFAAEIAAVAPAQVRRLVLANPLGLWLEDSPIPDLLATGGSAVKRLFWANPDSETAQAYQPQQFRRTCNWASATNYLWPIPDRGLAARLYHAKSPALVLRGSGDNIASKGYLEAFSNLMPNASTAEIEGAGHLAMLEQPEEFVRTVTAFLDS